MLNAEKYKDELKSLNEADKLWCSAFNKYYMTFGGCLDVKCENCAFNSEKGCSNGRYNWLLSEYKKPIKLSILEYEILKWLEKGGYKYIVRSVDDNLFIYVGMPTRVYNCWDSQSGCKSLSAFNDLFRFVRWTNTDPMLIKDILENCEVTNHD